MKTKKNTQANLEKRKGITRQMGLLLSLGLLFIAFEYSNADVTRVYDDHLSEAHVEIEYVPITRDIPKLPPPPTLIFDRITIVENTINLPDDIELTSMDPEDMIPTIFDFPQTEEIDPDTVFVIVEEAPEFPGGEAALKAYLNNNIRYPAIAQEMGIKGRVYVQFVVNKDGSIVDVEVLRGVDRSLDSEALRVIEGMPAWKPGKQRGKAVRVAYHIPINFSLK